MKIFFLIFALILASGSRPVTAGLPRVASPLWVRTIDSRNVDQWLSVRAGQIYTVKDGHVIAIDARNGRLRWTSAVRVESRPALGGRLIFAPTSRGIVALDPESGSERGRVRLPATPTLLTVQGTAFCLYVSGGKTRLSALRDSLAPRWQRTLYQAWDRPEDVERGVVLLHAADAVLALDTRTGAALAATGGVEDYVGRDGSRLWFSVLFGGLKSLDLTTATSTVIHNRIVRGAVRVEGRTAVAVIDGRLKSLSLPAGREAPLPIDGRWVGGPAKLTIFISRNDGVYALRLGQTWSTRIATNASDSRFVTATGTQAVFARNDGSIVVVDLADLKQRPPLRTDCRFVEGVRFIFGAMLVHCDDLHLRSRLYAFDLRASTP